MTEPHHGGCACGQVRYRMKAAPMIVHCCHCSWCQTQTGSAFAVNALIEAENVELLTGEVEEIATPSPSGKGQTIARCPTCRVALWSNYDMGGLRGRVRFVRVGTLDDPAQVPPDVHIFTTTKLPWVQIPPEHQAVEVFYDVETTYTAEALKRRGALYDAAGIVDPAKAFRG